jgi:transposase
MTYSVDFRRHVLSIKKKDGLTFEQTAKRFAVGIASLTRWNKTIIPKATRANRPRKVDLKALVKDVETHPDAYQHERALRFGVHPKSIWNGLRKLNITYKKSLGTPAGRRREAAYLSGKD